MRLADISVSRLHAVLRFQPPAAKRAASSLSLAGSGGISSVSTSPHGCFVIEDNRSKFGTLLEIRKPFRLDPQTVPISIQVGRTVLTFTLKRRWRFMFPACLRHQSADVSVILQQGPPQAPNSPPIHPPQRMVDPAISENHPLALTVPLERDSDVGSVDLHQEPNASSGADIVELEAEATLIQEEAEENNRAAGPSVAAVLHT